MPMEIVKQWKERTGLDIIESYGMTEAMPTTFNHYYPAKHRAGSVGDTVHGVEAQIRDTSGNPVEQGYEGEICIRGRTVMTAYVHNPEATRAAFWDGGWFRSGDVGLFDRDGYLYIVDRIKDLIITGPKTSTPWEVRGSPLRRARSRRVCGHRTSGQNVGRAGGRFHCPETRHVGLAGCAEALSRRACRRSRYPGSISWSKSCPRTPQGKVLKRDLRKEHLKE